MEILSCDIFSEIFDGEAPAGKEHCLKYLQNKINLTNFKDGVISAVYRHADGKRSVCIPLKPSPCTCDLLTCQWATKTLDLRYLSRFEFRGLLVEDGEGVLLVMPQIKEVTAQTAVFSLPETCLKINSDKPRSFQAVEIDAQVMQSGYLFKGKLNTFHPDAFHVQIDLDRPHSFREICSDTPATLVLANEEETVYIGQCRIAATLCTRETLHFRLCPSAEEIHHLRPKTYRSERVTPNPPLESIFTHPLTDKIMTLDVFDLSSLGFSLIVDRHLDGFPVGIILPNLELRFAGTRLLTCKAQVVHRHKKEGATDYHHCGLVIIDIDLADHTRLQAVVHQAIDMHTHVNTEVDMGDLWEFFFEAGFLYPEKYVFIEAYKDEIKETYKRLYLNSSFARHFIYKKGGRILGHMSMLRFYENSWMIQHHAARTASSSRAGFIVLAHISRFIKDAHMLSSMNLDYTFCFYRPDNHFPSRIFGGVAQSLDDPQGCSVDRFAYFHVRRNNMAGTEPLAPAWQLKAADPVDFLDLENSYTLKSGGLMIRALDFQANKNNIGPLSAMYAAKGFLRDRKIFALKREDQLAAVIELNMTDLGLNMSDLTNCIKVIVVREDLLMPNVIRRVLHSLAFCFFKAETVPVLVYPEKLHETFSFDTEKYYDLWILNLDFSEQYIEFISKFTRFADRDRAPR